jgi:DNA modification methylase
MPPRTIVLDEAPVIADRWRNRIIGYGEVDPEQLLANPLNWRIHSELQQDTIEGMLEEVGIIAPVLVNQTTGYVVDGHMRVALAIKRGQKKMPVVWLDLNADEERKAILTIDPISAMATAHAGNLQELMAATSTDNAAVQALLDDLRKRHVEFDARDGEGLTDPDAVPEIPKSPTTKPGDIWTLGDHRLVCGDIRTAGVLTEATHLRTADLVITDPPYGVGYVGKTKDALTIQGDDQDDGATRELVRTFLASMPLKDGGPFYLFSPAGNTELQFRLAIVDAGLELRQALVWVKDQFVMGRQDYHWRHESILYGWRAGAAHYFKPDRTLDTVFDEQPDPTKMTKSELVAIAKALLEHQQATVLREDRPRRSELHPTIKPVALYQRLLENSSLGGDVVLDGFAGSGTAAIACEQTGRRAAMVELDPAYCDVAVQRWEEFSGQKARRESTG